MEKTDFNNRRSGGGCYVPQTPLDEGRLIGKRDRKLIGKREQKLIEDYDKAPVAAATAPLEVPEPKRNSWFGWWVAGFVALVAVGLCLLFATKNSDFGGRNTASNLLGNNLKANIAADADANTTASGYNTGNGNSVARRQVKIIKRIPAASAATAATTTASAATATTATTAAYGSYPVATKALIDQYADNAATADYIYYFGNDKSAVPANAALDEIARKAEATGAEITVTAYASEVGSPAYNEQLSQKRAGNIADYLVAHGVDASHVKVKASGATDRFGGDAFNRRADITVDYAG